jgi:hypothetical protein
MVCRRVNRPRSRRRPARRRLATGALIVTLGVAAIGVPAAAGGGSGDESAGNEADRAKRAAVELVGGGRVVGVEPEGPGWRVEVIQPDKRLQPWMAETGTGARHLVVHLNGDLEWIRIGGSL